MFNLNDILQAAQGGQGITNMAQQFGLSPEQAQAAINALVPGLSAGMQNHSQNAGGLSSIIEALTHNTHQATFDNAAAAQAPDAAAAGGNILGQIFGTPQVTQQIAHAAAGQTGISPAILIQMMPVVASMVMGGMFSSMQKQGMGGLLGQLTSAAANSGGLGAILGQVMNAQAGAAQPAAGGGIGGILGGLFGGLMGGGAAQNQGQALPGGLNAPAIQAGIDALTKMMNPGVQVAAGHQQMIQDILGQLMRPAAR